jgi:hypothetical protein
LKHVPIWAKAHSADAGKPLLGAVIFSFNISY